MNNNHPKSVGRVFLVGAGPGDPGLITLRGVECLQAADAILYDYLVNPRILRHAPSHAAAMCVGKHGGDKQGGQRIWSQHEINAKLVELARAGQTVVRLKGGDPAVFARGVEEVETLVQHNIPFEIVPGITAALAAGSFTGIPLTHRDEASAVALVTGHECDKPEPALDYAALAKFPGTLVFYMGVTSAARWSAALIAGGKSADTPVAIIRRCSWPDQRIETLTLGQLCDPSSPLKVRPPVLFIVGEVVKLGPILSWFDKRPLFGQRVLVTRPESQAQDLWRPLTELGAEVLVQPSIRIEPTSNWEPVDNALRRLRDFDWLVFSSSNGVRAVLDRLPVLGLDLRALGDIQLAAIGPGTADELARYHLRADRVPPEFRAESLAATLAADAQGKRFLLARASRGREVLADKLRTAGGSVEQVVVYRSEDVTAPDPEIAKQLLDGRIHWITVTSSAIARSLGKMFGESLRHAKLASLSPITSATLRELNYAPTAEASVYTMPGLVQAISNFAAAHS